MEHPVMDRAGPTPAGSLLGREGDSPEYAAQQNVVQPTAESSHPGPARLRLARARRLTRRGFLKASAGLAAATGAVGAGYYATRDPIRLAVIGCGIRGTELARIASLGGYYLRRYGKIVALADVNRVRAEILRAKHCPGAEIYQDHKPVLERDDVDAVIVAPPDHWHAAITLEALRAGKAVYHEKPFTHTIQESQALIAAVKSAGLPFLVGTHQRSMWTCRTAAELVRNGRLGKVPKATVMLFNKGWRGGPFTAQPVPKCLDWDRWLGPAPEAAYCIERYIKFQGWWDYAGGEMTNWGTHHLDIAMWAMNLGQSYPVKVSGTAELTSINGGYDVPADFTARLEFATGETIEIKTTPDRTRPSGVRFEGERGQLWVDRDNIEGPAVSELRSRPLPPDAIRLHSSPATKTYPAVRHLSHFYDVVRGASTPVSDAETAHVANVALHLANIAIRVGRPIYWDPVAEAIIDDPQASLLLCAPRRAGYELRA
jgi:predicted dehydrogenase